MVCISRPPGLTHTGKEATASQIFCLSACHFQEMFIPWLVGTYLPLLSSSSEENIKSIQILVYMK